MTPTELSTYNEWVDRMTQLNKERIENKHAIKENIDWLGKTVKTIFLERDMDCRIHISEEGDCIHISDTVFNNEFMTLFHQIFGEDVVYEFVVINKSIFLRIFVLGDVDEDMGSRLS